MGFKGLLIWIMLLTFNVNAQLKETNFINEILENMAENIPEDFDLAELEDRLVFFYRHPINLNKTNPDELKNLIFLSPLQISNLFSYQNKYGPLADVFELQCVSEFDVQSIERLLPFVTVNPNELQEKISIKNLAKYGINDLIVRLGIGFEKPKGFLNLPATRYLGGREKYLFRYKYNYLNRLSASLVFEKDAGEYLFNGPKQYPFDFQSVHIAINNADFLKKMVLGDYTLQYGQGLTLWSGFAFGKSSDITSVIKRDVGLKPYTSSNEFSFFRGLAATIAIAKNLEFTSFYSNRNLSAGINIINGQETISALNKTGLHRTNTEINNKNTLTQQSYGGVLAYQTYKFSLGAIGYATRYNKNFMPANNLYSIFNFAGNQLTNFGIYYNYAFKNFYFYGEGGQGLSGGKALVGGALISLSSKINCIVYYRNIDKNYYCFFNQASAESSDAVNERGLYAGLNINLNTKWALSFYGDYFKFPWLRFRTDAPSNGYEVLAQLGYTPNKEFRVLLRYKSEIKQQNTDLKTPVKYLENVMRESYRTEINWKLSKNFNAQNRVEISQYQKNPLKAEFGYLVYQDVYYQPLSSKISGNLRFAYFNTPSYNSRIFAYENDLLYNFTFGLYNGKGLRSYLNLKCKLAKRLDFWIRYAITKYQDVESIGWGLDEIKGSIKSDARLQIRYQF